MVTDRAREKPEKKDTRYLKDTLKKDGLIPDEMFAAGRGIRSCTPPLETEEKTGSRFVTERLKRATPSKK